LIVIQLFDDRSGRSDLTGFFSFNARWGILQELAPGIGHKAIGRAKNFFRQEQFEREFQGVSKSHRVAAGSVGYLNVRLAKSVNQRIRTAQRPNKPSEDFSAGP
jgi:hypothetical protein